MIITISTPGIVSNAFASHYNNLLALYVIFPLRVSIREVVAEFLIHFAPHRFVFVFVLFWAFVHTHTFAFVFDVDEVVLDFFMRFPL